MTVAPAETNRGQLAVGLILATFVKMSITSRKNVPSCGAVSHWGDDCSLLPDYIRDKLHFNRNWSARYASNYIDAEAGNARLGRSTGGGGGGQAWQLAALNDMRD
ncbi:hypothetical protein KC352_g26757 [Hortaea werneckii]|nr:hypothetical protein KC352_g26757 [Hortaea werneckii]